MIVTVHNLYSEVAHTVQGTPEHVAAELCRLYPFLRHPDPHDNADVGALVDHLNACQAYDAEVQDYADAPIAKAEEVPLLHHEDETAQAMLGHHHELCRALEAARFLAGGPALRPEQARRALWEADGDVVEAALAVHGLEASPANRKALKAVLAMHQTHKADAGPLGVRQVEPGHPDAQEAAEAVARAFQDGFVLPIKLGGKHSAGALLARDPSAGRVWLLKPGANGQSPALGAQQDPSGQAQREAAFWHVADAWGLGVYLPRADLLRVDGRPYAAIELLPWSYRLFASLKAEHPGQAAGALAPYVGDGTAHRWGALDYVLGNPDRHAGNMMVHGRDVKLIDHGSAMAGTAFAPAHDNNSFTPYYLRAGFSGKFSALPPEGKLKAMPRLGREPEDKLRVWLDGLKEADLLRVLPRYGVDPAPAAARLAQLKARAATAPADLAVNQAWVAS